MSNSVKGQTPLKLADGREFVLVLDMEAMLHVEETTGKPLPKVVKMAQEGFMTAIAAIAQAAFSRHHPELARAQVLEMLRTDASVLEKALGDATQAAFPKAEVGKVPKGKPRPPAGKSFGASGAAQG